MKGDNGLYLISRMKEFKDLNSAVPTKDLKGCSYLGSDGDAVGCVGSGGGSSNFTGAAAMGST